MKKTITKISFIAIMLCVVMLAASCKKDDTTTTLTPPYKSSNPFVGNYNTIDTVTPADASPNDYLVNTFNITITQNISDTTKIDIFNLNNTSQTITANVFNDSINIPIQPFGANIIIVGFGKRENNKIFYNYIYYNPNGFNVRNHVKGEGTKFI
jgi:hypothetical protein